jgi:coenzyme F420-0:L-glutamate ligase/coenzyme F420-1:gamma-L-glutamate ligase
MTEHARLPELRVLGVPELPEVAAGDDLAQLIVAAVRRNGLAIEAGDIFVVTHKIVSKAEGRLVHLGEVEPSPLAARWSAAYGKDARLIELVLRTSRRLLRMDRGVLIAETHHGFVCANAGVDSSNIADGAAVLLPDDPDESARRLCIGLREAFGQSVAVIISDTFGRAWREGQVNVAVGVAGLRPIIDYRGRVDAHGHRLQTTAIAIADELASAAELVMGKTSAIPVALIKGAKYEQGEGSARELVRPIDQDLFR